MSSLNKIPVGARVMVDYPYAHPTPYEGVVLEYYESHDTYKVRMINSSHYSPIMTRDQIEEIWALPLEHYETKKYDYAK